MTTQRLTAAEKALLAELSEVPVPLYAADMRRPYEALRAKKLVKHNGRRLSDGAQVWALTPAGHEAAG